MTGFVLWQPWASSTCSGWVDLGTEHLGWARTQVASKLPEEDKTKLDGAIDEAVSWLDANQLAEVRAD